LTPHLRLTVFGALLVGSPAPSLSDVVSLDLGDYAHEASYRLSRDRVREASGLTYNYETGTLFLVSDRADGLIEISTTGEVLGEMALRRFSDTEGVTYIGNGRFVVVDEEEQEAYWLTYVEDGSADRREVPRADLGRRRGNSGLEGISYDPVADRYLTVKESNPPQVIQNVIDFDTGAARASILFSVTRGVRDLSGRGGHRHIIGDRSVDRFVGDLDPGIAGGD